MLGKLISRIFVFQKICKTCTEYQPLQIGGHKAPSINTKTSLLKSAKASSLFFFLHICVGGIGKLFKPKTRIFHLILNLRCLFKSHQYFMVLKSTFGVFFQDLFLLYGITPNHLGLMSRLVEMFFFSKI